MNRRGLHRNDDDNSPPPSPPGPSTVGEISSATIVLYARFLAQPDPYGQWTPDFVDSLSDAEFDQVVTISNILYDPENQTGWNTQPGSGSDSSQGSVDSSDSGWVEALGREFIGGDAGGGSGPPDLEKILKED